MKITRILCKIDLMVIIYKVQHRFGYEMFSHPRVQPLLFKYIIFIFLCELKLISSSITENQTPFLATSAFSNVQDGQTRRMLVKINI